MTVFRPIICLILSCCIPWNTGSRIGTTDMWNIMSTNFNFNCLHILNGYQDDDESLLVALPPLGWSGASSFGPLNGTILNEQSACAVLGLSSHFEELATVFQALVQNKLLWWIILEDLRVPNEYWDQLPLKLDSRLFLVKSVPSQGDVFQLFDIYRVGDSLPMRQKLCGYISSSPHTTPSEHCDLMGTFWDRRSNLSGLTITSYYESWPPYCVLDESSARLKGGIMYDIMETLSNHLHFKTEYQLANVRGVWGQQLPDGTWSGMIGDVLAGRADSIIAGVGVDEARHQSLDLTTSVIYNEANLFVRNPKTNDISIKAYTSEFKLDIWIAVAFVSLCSIGALYCIINSIELEECSKVESLSTSVEIVLRGAIQKGHSLSKPIKWYSFRLAVWFILLFEFFVFTSYRSAMNAFLTISEQRLPVNSLQDIIEQDFGIIIWRNGLNQNLFENAPKDSMAGKVFEHAQEIGIEYFSDIQEGVRKVLTLDNYVLFEYMTSMSLIDEFPCEIREADAFSKFKVHLTIPFKKNSPYTDLMNYHIQALQERGSIDKFIHQNLDLSKPVLSECPGQDKTSLGLSNTILPFATLCVLILTSVIVALVELMWSRLMKKSPRKRWETNSAVDDRRKICLSSAQIILESELADDEKILLIREICTLNRDL